MTKLNIIVKVVIHLSCKVNRKQFTIKLMLLCVTRFVLFFLLLAHNIHEV